MKVERIRRYLPGDRDAGLGLVEILVSMLILALLAIAVLPVLMQGMKTSSNTATLATAGQLAAQELEVARTLSADCATLSAFDDAPAHTALDARGVSLLISRSVGACPAAADYPGVVRVTVQVAKVDAPSAVLATATTLVLLEKAAP